MNGKINDRPQKKCKGEIENDQSEARPIKIYKNGYRVEFFKTDLDERNDNTHYKIKQYYSRQNFWKGKLQPIETNDDRAQQLCENYSNKKNQRESENKISIETSIEIREQCKHKIIKHPSAQLTGPVELFSC